MDRALFPVRVKSLRLVHKNPACHLRKCPLTTGRPTVGDFIYLFHNDASTIRVAFDHWSVGGPSSASLETDYRQPRVVTLSTGALFPPVSGSESESAVTRAVREPLLCRSATA